MAIDGHWLTTATTKNTPSGDIVWHDFPGRAHIALVNDHVVARIRYVENHKQYLVVIPGWQWYVTKDMAVSMFNLKETSVLSCKTVEEAKTAVETAWAVPRHLPQ